MIGDGVHVRAETVADAAPIRALHEAAFATDFEARLVEALREAASPLVSLVAEQKDVVIGHIMFSPACLRQHPGLRLMGLGPMAVLPVHQRSGVGSALVRAGLAECVRLGCDAVLVLGHPAYYPRFGFTPAVRFGLRCEYDVPEEVFMALELTPGSLNGVSGRIEYHPVFNEG